MNHGFNVEIATQYGITEAILLEHLNFWIAKNKADKTNFFDGYYWTYSSTKALAELFPYLSPKSISRALHHLKEEGLVLFGNYNKSAYDRTMWYALTEAGESVLQNGKMDLSKGKMEEPKMENQNAQNVQPIPDISTDISTDIVSNDTCTEPEKPASAPPVITLPLNDNTDYGITQDEAVRDDYKAAQVGKLLSGTRVTAAGVNEQIGQLLTELEALRDDKAAKAKTLAQIAAEYQNNYFCEHPDGLKVGLPNLDDMIGGLEGGAIIVIGARPAVGKSALVTQITTNLAEQGKKIGFYNLEMSDKQMYERFVASQSGLGLTRIRRAVKFLGDEEKRFKMANNALAERSNIVISTGAKTVSEIRSESRHMGFDVIVIDYLQLIRSDTFYRGNRVAEVGAISKAIKALAMELNIPIILLSQLNRASEGRETREPSMSELRESGDIEQDASVIILLWNMSEEDRSKKGCKVEKNRQGETGKMELRFDGDKMRFKDAGEWQESVEDCPFT